ncbi:DUF551 domain-containing protein [Gallintestinimicrobium sp.]|uniref:DUF551 domain-containing protein n=1 Tax=Gallintestinimicrobium sp. TaxID=2981655 RepID=UPI00399B9BC7
MLKEILEELLNRYRVVKTDEDLEWNRAVDMCRSIIEKHINDGKDTDVPTKDGWIPVAERLPEDNVAVLITYSDMEDEKEPCIAITTYGYATLGGNKLYFKEWRSPFLYFKGNYKVIAWQPLPEPYRPVPKQDKPSGWQEQMMGAFLGDSRL